jgi:CRP-like cAMP-binding protein
LTSVNFAIAAFQVRSGARRWSAEAMAATRNYLSNPTFRNFAKFRLGPAIVMLLRIAEKYSVTSGRADHGGADMNSNRAGLHISESVWTHEHAAIPRSTPEQLESLATTLSRYQRDEEIYPQQGPVEYWYQIVSGAAARRYALRADGRRQIVDLLLPGDFFGFGFRGAHVFTADAISADTVVRRHPVAQIETLATSDAGAARGQCEIVFGAMSRMHSLLN